MFVASNEEWETVDRIARFLRARLGAPPEVVAVLGSGLGAVAGGMSGSRDVSFDEIPEWPPPTVDGHLGRLHRGELAGVEALVQVGRIHLYEGYSPQEVVRPVRAAIAWGAKTVILTNAAGFVGDAARPGDLMVIEDHINMTGTNPLVGYNDGSRGERFPDMTETYDSSLRALALERAAELGITLRTGVYAGGLGPSYETPAEVRAIERLGADAVGMSTVLEAVAARHMGARVVGISCLTNRAGGARGSGPTHDEVQIVGARAADDLTRLLGALLGSMGRLG